MDKIQRGVEHAKEIFKSHVEVILKSLCSHLEVVMESRWIVTWQVIL